MVDSVRPPPSLVARVGVIVAQIAAESAKNEIPRPGRDPRLKIARRAPIRRYAAPRTATPTDEGPSNLIPDYTEAQPEQDLVVLVVDDQRFQRRLLGAQLESLGATTVLEAGDGAEALGVIDAHPGRISLIITDIEMPNMDGLALLRRIGERLPTVPTVVLSSLDEQLLRSVEAMSRAFKVSLLAILSKPATEEALAAAIEHARLSSSGSHAGPALQMDNAALKLALAGNELEPWFQPKVRLIDGVPCGAEVLIRWRHPDHGVLTPAAFIDALENSPLLRPVTLMLAARVAKLVGIVRGRFEPFTLSVNITPRLLDDPDFALALANTITERGVAPKNMTIEVTESAMASCEGAAIENLTRLRMRGFGLSIDDFGTGHSSLERLSRVPFTELKVDRGFVMELGRSDWARTIAAQSVTLAKALGLRAVAEGIEDEATMAWLRSIGCDAGQGFGIARPTWIWDLVTWGGHPTAA